MTDLVSKEVAVDEFERFLEAMDIDGDVEYMDDEDSANFRKAKGRIIRAIVAGSVMINEEGEAVFTAQNEKSRLETPLTFHERTGASLMASDGKKQNQQVAKTYAMMADMCKTSPKTFANLVGSDIKICEALFALLMD